jgi:hypothetical protein
LKTYRFTMSLKSCETKGKEVGPLLTG